MTSTLGAFLFVLAIVWSVCGVGPAAVLAGEYVSAAPIVLWGFIAVALWAAVAVI
jgi:hypothetical protein